MRSWIFAYCLLAAIVVPLTAGQTLKTVKYPYPGGVDSVSFDPAKVKRIDLDNWMRFSPHLSPYNDLLVPIDIRRCIPDDEEYSDCKKDGKIRIPNVDENIRRIANIQESLRSKQIPDGLRPITSYLLEKQTFALWAARQQRALLTTRDWAAPMNQYDGIDSTKCASILQKTSNSEQRRDPTELILVDWFNCVMTLEKEKIGPYPKKEWQAFLKSHGIKEEAQDEDPDFPQR